MTRNGSLSQPPSHSSTVQPYARPRDTLLDTLRLLDAFNHRHHNQHRASHWWSNFGRLRRSVRALHGLLPDKHINVSRVARITTRAEWMKNQIMPRSYVSFTQLAADNQHAPLGLMLLAILARIQAVLLDLIPEERNPPRSADEEHLSIESSKAEQNDTTKLARGDIDRGIAVLRDPDSTGPKSNVQLPNEGHLDRSVATSSTLGGFESPRKDKCLENRKKKKKRDKSRDELSNLFGSLS